MPTVLQASLSCSLSSKYLEVVTHFTSQGRVTHFLSQFHTGVLINALKMNSMSDPVKSVLSLDNVKIMATKKKLKIRINRFVHFACCQNQIFYAIIHVLSKHCRFTIILKYILFKEASHFKLERETALLQNLFMG